jgi:hypothetical protein
MAVHIETGTMVAPGYKSRTLAHLGLVAGMYEELGIGEVIDRAVPQDEERRFTQSGTDHDILLSEMDPPSILEQMTPTH